MKTQWAWGGYGRVGGGTWNVAVFDVTVDAWFGATSGACASEVTGAKIFPWRRTNGCGWAVVVAVAAVSRTGGGEGFRGECEEGGSLSRTSALRFS